MAYGVSAASPAIQQSYSAAYQPQIASNGPAAPAPGPPDLATAAMVDLGQQITNRRPPTPTDAPIKSDFIAILQAANYSPQRQQMVMNQLAPKMVTDVMSQLNQAAVNDLQNAAQGNMDKPTVDRELDRDLNGRAGPIEKDGAEILFSVASSGARQSQGPPMYGGSPHGGVQSYGGGPSSSTYSMGPQYQPSRAISTYG
jgi:hypothetical protein